MKEEYVMIMHLIRRNASNSACAKKKKSGIFDFIKQFGKIYQKKSKLYNNHVLESEMGQLHSKVINKITINCLKPSIELPLPLQGFPNVINKITITLQV